MFLWLGSLCQNARGSDVENRSVSPKLYDIMKYIGGSDEKESSRCLDLGVVYHKCVNFPVIL